METRLKHKKDQEIYKKYNKLVLDFFYKKTSNLNLSKDLTAETMSKIITHYEKKFNDKTIDNWVHTITKNHFTDYIRKINAKKYIKFNEFNEFDETYNDVVNNEISIDYEKKFGELEKIIETTNDTTLKNFFKYKYLYAADNKTIIKELNFSYKKIAQYDNKLIDFFKNKISDDLFM